MPGASAGCRGAIPERNDAIRILPWHVPAGAGEGDDRGCSVYPRSRYR